MSAPGIEVTFTGAGSLAMAGTLVLPRAAEIRGAPAVVLVQGSGPTDRDGNQPPRHTTNLLKTIAESLAARGIASIRYDKRGLHANIAQRPSSLEDATRFARWENFVGDLVGAVACLRGQPGVDASRVAILGHSEGGLLALAASESLEPPAAALVLAATPGRPMSLVIREQLDRVMLAQGAAPEERAAILAENDRILDQVQATGRFPATFHPGLSPLYPPYLRLFWQSIARLDPAALAARRSEPILVINGERDEQVSAERDARCLSAALAPNGSVRRQLCIVAGAGHDLSGSNRGGVSRVLPEAIEPSFGSWRRSSSFHA